MPKRILYIAITLVILWLGSALLRTPSRGTGQTESDPALPTSSEDRQDDPGPPLPGEALLEGFGSPDQPPIEDVRKLHRVLVGYFSVVKDTTRHPIGGNADLSACLLGDNLNRQAFVRPDHPVFNGDGLITDRWGTPVFVHPEAAREITLRSAGPDREMFTDDDLVILPTGLTP